MGRTNPSSSSRQRIHNKLIRVGYKTMVFADTYGYVSQFKPNQGVKKGRQVASSTKYGLGENIVLRMMKCLPPTASYHKLMDSYFTFFRLLTHLEANNVGATGVLNKNRLRKCTIIGDKQLQKKETRPL